MSMPLAEIKCEDPTGSGLVMEHNMPCAVCGVEKAVISCNSGVFDACWKCQKNGWTMMKTPKHKTFKERFWGWLWFEYYELKLVNKRKFNSRKANSI